MLNQTVLPVYNLKLIHKFALYIISFGCFLSLLLVCYCYWIVYM